MVELILTGSELPPALKPSLELYLAIPAFYSPEMSDEDWQSEINRMFQSSQLTRLFVDGRISPADYECGLAELGINPYQVEECWSEGESLLL